MSAAERKRAPVRHTAGNLFRSRGVGPGDLVYIVTVIQGRLFLATRIEVDCVVDQDQAEVALGTTSLWEAKDHVIAKSDMGKPANYRRQVPLEIVKRLRFIEGRGPAIALTMDSKGLLDRQTLRGVRELSPSSAATLDSLIV